MDNTTREIMRLKSEVKFLKQVVMVYAFVFGAVITWVAEHMLSQRIKVI